MKSTLISVFTLSLITLFLFSCNSEPKNNQNRTTIGSDTSAYQIGSDTAQININAYKDYVTEVSDSLDSTAFPDVDKKLVFGAKVKLEELKRVLLRADTLDSLYIMMGIMPTGDPQLIFAFKTDPKLSKTPWMYLDFTRPCPSSCPSWLVYD